MLIIAIVRKGFSVYNPYIDGKGAGSREICCRRLLRAMQICFTLIRKRNAPGASRRMPWRE